MNRLSLVEARTVGPCIHVAVDGATSVEFCGPRDAPLCCVHWFMYLLFLVPSRSLPHVLHVLEHVNFTHRWMGNYASLALSKQTPALPPPFETVLHCNWLQPPFSSPRPPSCPHCVYLLPILSLPRAPRGIQPPGAIISSPATFSNKRALRLPSVPLSAARCV